MHSFVSVLVSRRIAGSIVAASIVVAAGAASAQTSDPFADRVVGYDPGSAFGSAFTDPTAALGEPSRSTDPGFTAPGPVTPFFPAAQTDQVVTIGEGGFLTVAFDQAVTNDARNPFGIDLLVFGNTFYLDLDFPNGVAGSTFFEGGVIEISDNGTDFVVVSNLFADGSDYPTLAFNTDGTPTDFTLPVDPSFDASGLGIDEIAAGYAGSGGGVGIDIGAFGFDEISFVRITNPVGSGLGPEIDGFADVVPTPGTLALAGAFGLMSTRRRR